MGFSKLVGPNLRNFILTVFIDNLNLSYLIKICFLFIICLNLYKNYIYLLIYFQMKPSGYKMHLYRPRYNYIGTNLHKFHHPSHRIKLLHKHHLQIIAYNFTLNTFHNDTD